MTIKHLVLGNGNLAADLVRTLDGFEGKHIAAQSAPRWRYPTHPFVAGTFSGAFDYVWCAVGGGSVEFARDNKLEASRSLHMLPVELIQQLPPKVKLVLFSTDYVANETDPSDPNKAVERPRSYYANLKLMTEEVGILSCRENLRIVRVGSLYGSKRPERNLAEKLRKHKPATLPANRICPTSTRWLSIKLVKTLDTLFEAKGTVQHCAPVGSMTVAEFGRLVLDPQIVLEGPIDPQRPALSDLRCSFSPVDTLQKTMEIFPV